MELNNLYQICIFFAISLVVFNLAISLVSGLQIFGNADVTSVEPGVDSSDTMGDMTKGPDYPDGMVVGTIWGVIFGGATVAGVVMAYALQDASILGVFIFSGVFWSSYINSMVVITSMAFIPVALVGLFTVPILFIFVGAAIGMLSGV